MLANLIYAVALALVSPIVVYRMVRQGRYRRGVREKLCGLSERRARELSGDGSCIWIHAVSVGEVNLLNSLVPRLQQRVPGQRIVISASTDTGYDLAVDRFGADRVFFCPLDFSWAVHRTVSRLRPTRLILTELELWPNLVRIATNEGCRVEVINARLSERSAGRYRRFSRLTRPIFERLSWVGCQDEPCRQRFFACGVAEDRLSTTGSMKFDDAPESRETPEVHACAHWAGVDPWHRVWVVGSTQPGEEEMALRIYRQLRGEHSELRLVLVPRHAGRFDEVAELVARYGFSVHRRSSDDSLFGEHWDSHTVILVDTIGELRAWWGVGQIASVGGSFGDRGGQNMLEPAGYGSAVSFGPDTRNFERIAAQLIDAGGAVRVEGAGGLQEFVRRCLTDIPAADALGRAARDVIRRHRGATQRTLDGMVPRERKNVA